MSQFRVAMDASDELDVASGEAGPAEVVERRRRGLPAGRFEAGAAGSVCVSYDEGGAACAGLSVTF